MGKTLFLAIWGPIITLMFALSRQLQDKRGRVPKWFGVLMGAVFGGMWVCYDEVFRKAFGDGERTVGDDDEDVVRGGDREKMEIEEEGVRLLDGKADRRMSVIEGWSDEV